MPAHQGPTADQPATRPSWVTQADRAAWQRQAAAELAAILAAHPDLPAITWTITSGGGLTGQALVPGDPVGTRKVFNAWQRSLGLHDPEETPAGHGTSYVRARISRGTIHVTLTAVVVSSAAADNRGRPSPDLVQSAGTSGPDVDATSGQPWARPATPPRRGGPSPA